MHDARRIIFVLTPDVDPWGGSGHELWSRAALYLASEGVPVSLSLPEASSDHPRMLELRSKGVEFWLRPTGYPWRKRAWDRLASRRKDHTLYEIQRLIAARPPALVVLLEGIPFPPINIIELCVANKLPFATLAVVNWEAIWYPDDDAERYRTSLSRATRCFFVSEANLRLAEKQIGGELANGEVVRTPFNVPYDASPPWSPSNEGECRFACVGRLHPPSKGQDALFEALARTEWQNRRWCLAVYGNGPARHSLEWLTKKLNLSERVAFAGFSRPEKIWTENHVLLMPSRCEGLPLAIIEAMLCGRPVVATNVGGHAEVIEEGVTGFLADAPTANSIAAAMERFWARRNQAQEIGKAGARRIRQLVPADPVRLFSEKLKILAGLTAGQ
jgi:glycosyltransferase involved in cell wall biosynthesis